jgi:hypothetical protein
LGLWENVIGSKPQYPSAYLLPAYTNADTDSAAGRWRMWATAADANSDTNANAYYGCAHADANAWAYSDAYPYPGTA